ncbi:MAG TPA: M48 family metalloprotease, partial [Solirubrobacteraceae bacterium]|nr:M48 family metalloprotease [Solirubrobacteraceae bacterium]
MSRHSRVRAVWPGAVAAVTAEAARRVLAPRAPALNPVRVDVGAYFSADEIARGRRYARPQLALGLARSLVDAAALVSLVRRPPAPLRRPWRSPAAGGAATAAGLSLALSLPTLPLRAVSRRRSMAVGLDTQSWGAWAADVVKASAIQTVFAGGAGAAVIAGTRRFPRQWWAPMGAGAVVFGAGLAALAPVVLDPIFNDFTPLPDGELRSDVLGLARDAGVTVGEVFSVDASRRTTAANAYVTGLGPTKRVVLFDTLLDRYAREEIRLVVAHELAHVRHRDVRRGLAYAAVVAPATALAVQRLSWELTPERGTPATLPALALAAMLITGPIGMIGNRLSRAMERRADHFALELAGAPDA